MINKENWFIFISLTYIGYLIFPYFSHVSNIPNWLMSITVSVILAAMYPRSWFRSYFKWFLLYFFVLLMYSLFGHPFHINGIVQSMAPLRKLTIEVAWILPSLLICNVILQKNSNKVNKWIGLGAITMLTLSFVTIIPILSQNAGLMRDNISSIDSGEEGIVGFPSYTLMGCYSFIFPVLCYGFSKFHGRLKAIFLGLIFLFVYVIAKTEITTSLLTAIFSIVFMFIYKDKSNYFTIMTFIAVSGIFIVLYQTGVVLNFVEWLQVVFEDTAASPKMQDFHDTITMGKLTGINIEVRMYTQNLSLQSFLDNPIIGSEGVGYHSSLLDRLGSMGLLGFIPYIMMLLTNVFLWFRTFKERREKYFYLIGIIVIFIFLYNKGLFSGEGMLFMTVLLPTSIVAINDISNK